MRKAGSLAIASPIKGGPVPHIRSVESGFSFACGDARRCSGGDFWDTIQLRIPAKALAILLLPLTLAACLDSDDTRTTSFVESADAAQPFPANYKPEILAFLRTYLNNPAGVHEAAIAEPVQRTVNGRVRYVSCLRFAERQTDGSYRDPRERGVLFVGGRLDRLIPNASEECAGAVYAAFPELEKLQR
jgi:hypothetical protein